MKPARIALCVAAVGLFAGCAYVPPKEDAARRVSPDYIATGGVEDARAYIYGSATLLEFGNSAPAFVTVRDESGETIEYERVGRYYRLARVFDNFTVWANDQSVTFSAPMITRVFSAPRADEAKAPEVFKVAAAAAIVKVSFPTGSTVFKPSPEVAAVLISSGKAADRVNVRGRTDSRIAGPLDAKIALGRALAARKFLLDHGVSADKIRVFSQAEGGFAAPNVTKEGRALNRRVEIEFVNARIAELKGQSGNRSSNQ